MAQSKEVAKPFDSAALAEQLRDKIRADLAELMPPEMWKSLLQSEIDKFLKPGGTVGYGRSEQKLPSPFAKIVLQVLETETRERVKQLLQSDDWCGHFDGFEHKVSKKVAELVTEHSSDILSAILRDAVQQVVSGMQHQL